MLEQSHDNATTWFVAAPLNCGNTPQTLTSANFTAAGVDLNFGFTPADTAPKQNARYYATNLLSELDAPGEFYFEITTGTSTRASASANVSDRASAGASSDSAMKVMKVHMIPPPGHSSDPTTWGSGPVIGYLTHLQIHNHAIEMKHTIDCNTVHYDCA